MEIGIRQLDTPSLHHHYHHPISNVTSSLIMDGNGRDNDNDANFDANDDANDDQNQLECLAREVALD